VRAHWFAPRVKTHESPVGRRVACAECGSSHARSRSRGGGSAGGGSSAGGGGRLCIGHPAVKGVQDEYNISTQYSISTV
jgi:hypothetical protein